MTKIYESEELKLLFLGDKSVLNYVKRNLKDSWNGNPNINIWGVYMEKQIKKLIKNNSNTKIFWKLKMSYQNSDNSSTERSIWFLNRKEAKKHLQERIQRDFWFNHVNLDKYKLLK